MIHRYLQSLDTNALRELRPQTASSCLGLVRRKSTLVGVLNPLIRKTAPIRPAVSVQNGRMRHEETRAKDPDQWELRKKISCKVYTRLEPTST